MGRSLNETDIRDRRKVCVIGKRIYETLFPKKDNPCGQFIEINGIYYRVVGVNEATGNMSVNGQSETSVVIPFTTMQQNYNRGKQIDMLGYTAKKGYSISQVEKDVERTIKLAHAIHPDDEQAVIRAIARAMFSIIEPTCLQSIRPDAPGWLVGLGTLLAGAIGVSNIMMITVKERTTEIGIRRVIGARPDDILQQILLEYGTPHAGRYGGHIVAVFLLNIVKQYFGTFRTSGTFPLSVSGRLHRSLHPARCSGTACRTDSCLPRHGYQTDRGNTRRINAYLLLVMK
ncbi:MAG: ABC transporter permease [Phocaeicola coprocola]